MTTLQRNVICSLSAVVLAAPQLLAQRGPVTESFAPVVKKVQPAVVNISTTVVRKSPGRGEMGPFDFFFGPGQQQQPREQRGHSLGSGVIVRADGYLLTNSHVVADATDIKVVLSDRRELKATLVGSDPQSDIAVLKLDVTGLPVLPFGDSEKAEVGDIVLALGNPFGIGQTVTMGIIGAVGRSGLNIEQYENFIQTDAAINPGNSGGALINAKGELVGINTAILSESGGNMGVGFAVPINMARNVMDQIMKSGKVVRGYMGAGIQDVTPALAKGLGLKDSRGVAITQVEKDSPAEKSGLRPGDVVTAIDGGSVETSNALRLKISSLAPGTNVKLSVQREDGSKAELPVTLAQLPARDGEAKNDPSGTKQKGSAMEGVTLEELTPRIARQLRLQGDVTGLVVTAIDPSSPAAEAGLQRGDVIQKVNRQPVATMSDFDKILAQGAGKPVLLLVNRGGRTAFVAVEPAK